MTFSNLRSGNQIFVLHREATPYLEIGQVINVTAPMPMFNQFASPTNYAVDVTAKVGDSNITYSKLPSNAEVADWGGNGNMVVATTRDAMNAELNNLRQKSLEVLQSVDYHKETLKVVDKILQQLNPEYAEKAVQQEEIQQLKKQLADMSTSLNEIMSHLKGEKVSKTKNTTS